MKELEQTFKALADVTRLRILNLLLHGELCVCDIHFVLDSPQPNVSRHLTYLKNSGLVRDRREGPRVYYALTEPAKGLRHHLFAFLGRAFEERELLKKDLHKLAKAVERGTCNASEWPQVPELAPGTRISH